MKFHVRSAVPGQGITATGGAHATCTDVPGWEGWQIELHVKMQRGRPRAVGINGLAWIGQGDPPPLTTARMAALPLQHLADVTLRSVDFTPQPELKDALARVRAADDTGHRDPRSVVTPRQVAKVWLEGFHDPKITDKKAYTAQRLHVSERTVANKLNEAHDAGLIPDDFRPRRRKRQ